jgi:hypothetical protein
MLLRVRALVSHQDTAFYHTKTRRHGFDTEKRSTITAIQYFIFNLELREKSNGRLMITGVAAG